MKFSLATISLFLFLDTTLGGHIPDCSDFDVTDKTSCMAWCGGEGHFDLVTKHKDTVSGMHVEQLRGMECHCAGEHDDHDHRRRKLAEEDGHDHGAEGEEEKSCWIGYKFPTCAEKGLVGCEIHEDEEDMLSPSSNETMVAVESKAGESTMTCAEICASLGLDQAESGCGLIDLDFEGGDAMHMDEGDHDGHDHRHRIMAEEDEHDHEHDDEHTENHVTLCLCPTDASAEEGVLVCADEGWEGEGHDDEKEESSATTSSTRALTWLAFSGAVLGSLMA